MWFRELSAEPSPYGLAVSCLVPHLRRSGVGAGSPPQPLRAGLTFATAPPGLKAMAYLPVAYSG